MSTPLEKENAPAASCRRKVPEDKMPTPEAKRATPHAQTQSRGHPRALATRLREGNCELEQIARVGDFALYHRTKAGRCRGFELVRIRHHAARQTPFGLINAHESYPTANVWGKDAITIPDRDEALERLAESARLGAVASLARRAARDGGVPE